MLKLALSCFIPLKGVETYTEIQKMPGVTPPDPRFRGKGGKRNRGEGLGGRGWEERGEEKEGEGGEDMELEGGKVKLGENPPPL